MPQTGWTGYGWTGYGVPAHTWPGTRRYLDPSSAGGWPGPPPHVPNPARSSLGDIFSASHYNMRIVIKEKKRS